MLLCVLAASLVSSLIHLSPSWDGTDPVLSKLLALQVRFFEKTLFLGIKAILLPLFRISNLQSLIHVL